MKPWKGRLQRMPQRGCLGNGRCSPISSFWLVQAVRRQPGGCPSRPAFNILQKEIEVINQGLTPFFVAQDVGSRSWQPSIKAVFTDGYDPKSRNWPERFRRRAW